ncbi:hypothetical protein B0H67DRAFT_549910 [Lasiosphaeris hirsuta]|uniref:Uncharacterized protein n=1 Tax=Lasiosphaeris hirsuta TaxID=260670 RepID=A0AA40BDP4_9PEZI|nr:hypothetical protein B0H67DRAFT_549910 [Lasiosphaeris hirsuta]
MTVEEFGTYKSFYINEVGTGKTFTIAFSVLILDFPSYRTTLAERLPLTSEETLSSRTSFLDRFSYWYSNLESERNKCKILVLVEAGAFLLRLYPGLRIILLKERTTPGSYSGDPDYTYVILNEDDSYIPPTDRLNSLYFAYSKSPIKSYYLRYNKQPYYVVFNIYFVD